MRALFLGDIIFCMKKIKRLPAEMWDRMQFLFRNYYDRTMHATFYYDGELDVEVLKNAYMAVVNKIPVLHSTFHNSPIKPYWTVNDDFSADDFFTFTETDDPDSAFDKFITREVSPYGKAQFRATVIRHNGKDIWAVVCNHMCFDGTDLRYFNMKVAESYNRHFTDNDYDVEVKSGTRSAEQVYSKMDEEDYKHAKSLYKNVSTVENKITFPFGPDDDTLRSRMILKKLPSETFLKMKARGKAMGATVNDVIVAAYFKALFAFVKTDGKALTVPCMYDLRRYCGGHSEGLTNMIGFMPCTMDKVGDTMTETVELVRAALQPAKEDRFTGLYSLPLLKLAYTVFPQVIAEFAIKLGYTNPYIGMSNIGIVNPAEVTMNGMAPYDAFYSGAIKFKPYMQLALTTFKNEITFSTAVRVTDAEEKVFRSFLDKVVEELTTFAEGNN